MNTREIYAHTLDGRPSCEWEPLYGPGSHAERTAAEMAAFRVPFASAVCNPIHARYLMRLLALTHDMGKASADFQAYLLRGGGAKVDHKSAAVKWWQKNSKLFGTLMSYVCFGHHGGLNHGVRIDEHLEYVSLPPEIEKYLPDELQHGVESVPFQTGQNSITQDEKLFSLMMAVRMFHSCLVDADWLATESFRDPERYKLRKECQHASMSMLSQMLEEYIAEREKKASGYINELRKLVHKSCYQSARQAPGVFRLNVPTGGGKSLSSLSFALQHAHLHQLERVIYVIPYTSIIDQIAGEYRSVLGEDQVVEHHSNVTEEADSENNRFAAENWDAPVIITTSVLFFESLFSCQNPRCRKIHNIANSVIVFDEVQTLPSALLKPCLFAMKTLQRDYNCSLVLCTATQPALTNHEQFDIGWPEGEVKSLLGESLETKLAREMKRVEVELLGSISEEILVEHFLASGMSSALMIVNLTTQAQHLFELLQEQGVEGLYHLSARMCPAHRVAVLTQIRERLSTGQPTVLVATRVVEAGVDISFPVVYRDCCGLDSLAQAAGRCNRHGELDMGKVYSFLSSEYTLPDIFVDLRNGGYAMADIVSNTKLDELFEPQVVNNYFVLFYDRRKNKSWDQKGIFTWVNQHYKVWDFPEIAQRFRFIDQEQLPLLVSYGEEGELIRAELSVMDKHEIMPGRRMFRRLQAFSVNVYREEWNRLRLHCECVHQKAGIWMLRSKEGYDAQRGLLKDFQTQTEYIF